MSTKSSGTPAQPVQDEDYLGVFTRADIREIDKAGAELDGADKANWDAYRRLLKIVPLQDPGRPSKGKGGTGERVRLAARRMKYAEATVRRGRSTVAWWGHAVENEAGATFTFEVHVHTRSTKWTREEAREVLGAYLQEHSPDEARRWGWNDVAPYVREQRAARCGVDPFAKQKTTTTGKNVEHPAGKVAQARLIGDVFASLQLALKIVATWESEADVPKGPHLYPARLRTNVAMAEKLRDDIEALRRVGTRPSSGEEPDLVTDLRPAARRPKVQR
jgi:hypothetical protein